MQVDQSQLLEQLAYQKKSDTSKGIANYIAAGAENKAGVGGFQKKVEDMSIHSAQTVDMSNTTYMRPGAEDEKTVADMLDGDGDSAMSRYNEMAVIANTTSGEDLKSLQENGYSIGDTDSRTIVTVTDKIKAALAKAGVDVSGYGGSLSQEQLEEITGSSALANRIAGELRKQDLPVTPQNIADMTDAVEKIEQLEPVGEDEFLYLIKNNLPPTIQNIYCAEYGVGAAGAAYGNAGVELNYDAFTQLKPMISRTIREAGLEVNADTIDDSRFLLENGVSLTAKNLTYLENLKELAVQMEEGNITEDMFQPMCDAIEEGGRPMDAMLLRGYSMRDRAQMSAVVIQEATDDDLAYVIAEDKDLTVNNLKTAEANRDSDTETTQAAHRIVTERGLALLTAKRQLEEVRLAMTSEANYALLKRGISVDTKPLIELVEDLRSQEDQYYRALLQKEGIYSESNVAVFRETDEIVEELKSAPAYVIKPGDPDTLRSLHQEGMALKERFVKANQSYEALMTTPREELGDSIKKAFGNIDNILKSIGLDTSEANQRAVRILAYNSTEITPENIAQVKAKDEEVQRAFVNLTPKVTMEMIRQGINPLDMDMNELNEVAQEIKENLGEVDTELYQKYLWKLEQNNKITSEERKSYIGIYRLITQVERTDNAAIGSLVQQGTEITMRSLLTALRIGQKTPVDYRVGDGVTGTRNDKKNEQIDDQIMASYHKNCLHDAREQMTPKAAEKLRAAEYEEMTPEQVKEVVEQAVSENLEEDQELERQYFEQQMEEYSEVFTTPEKIYEYLEDIGLPNTMNNILAVREMFKNRNMMFDTLWKTGGTEKSSMEQIEEMKNEVIRRFGEAVKTPEEMADAQEALAEVATHVMDTMIIENDETGTLDLKALRLMNAQFSVCAKQAKQESYMIPVQTGNGVTGVSLKIVRGMKKKGMVDIMFESSALGKVAATIEAKEDGISGMIVTERSRTRGLLNDQLVEIAQMLRGDGEEKIDLRVAKVSSPELVRYENHSMERQLLDAESRASGTTENDQDGTETYKIQTARLYQIAESFIQAVQRMV